MDPDDYRIRHYILDANHQPIEEPDLLTWAKWHETTDRHVGFDRLGAYEVSTVFLGLDHNILHSIHGRKPHLFETMIFAVGRSRPPTMVQRYATWDEAKIGHEAIVRDLNVAVRN